MSPEASRQLELLEQRLAHLEALNSFHEEILKVIRIYTSSERFTSERCLQEVVSFIQKKFDIYLVDVLLVDEAAGELILFVAAGEEVQNRQVKGFRLKIGEGITGECARTGELAIVNDVEHDPRFVRGPLAKTRSEICVPVKVKGRCAGILDLQDEAKNRFTRDFATLMEQLAFEIGFLLENKKLHDDLKERTRQLERDMSHKVSELKRSEERYRSIVENAADPIFTTDLNGTLGWANRATYALCDSNGQPLEGVNLSKLVKKGHMHTVYQALRDASEGRETQRAQLEIVTRKGEERIVECFCMAIREGGKIDGVEFTLRDITDKIVIEKLKKNYMKSLEEAVIQRTAEIKDTQRAAVLAMANLAESIDDDTGSHIQRIQHYSKVLAEELQKIPKYRDTITDEYIELVTDLSPLHDLGKVGIRDYILQKPDKLTEEEFEIMKTHSEIGARALRMAGEMIHREGLFSIAEMIARYHHEKWDGSGYPAVDINGEHRPLRGEEIPLCARLVALADVYDALTSKRPYKMPFPHEKAKELIVAQSGKHFDPEVVQAFLRREADFVRIRNRFPETALIDRPFVLPARDRKD